MPVRTVTLTPDTPTPVSVDEDYDFAAVFHTGNTTEAVYATVNDVDPVADADNVYMIPAGARRTIARPGQTGPADVRLLSTGAVKVEVEFG